MHKLEVANVAEVAITFGDIPASAETLDVFRYSKSTLHTSGREMLKLFVRLLYKPVYFLIDILCFAWHRTFRDARFEPGTTSVTANISS